MAGKDDKKNDFASLVRQVHEDARYSEGSASLTEDLEAKLSAMTEDELMELERSFNPYSFKGFMPPPGAERKYALMTYFDSRATYQTKFATTSLIGFLFQMLHEHETPIEKRRWVPRQKDKTRHPPMDYKTLRDYAAQTNLCSEQMMEAHETCLKLEGPVRAATDTLLAAAKSANAARKVLADFEKRVQDMAKAAAEVARLKKIASPTPDDLAALKEAERKHGAIAAGHSETKLAEAKERWTKDDAAAAKADDALKALKKELNDAECKRAAMRLAVTHDFATKGVECDKRLHATTEDAKRFPDVSSMLKSIPDRGDVGSMFEVPPAVAKGIVSEFLARYLQFDPSVHVRSAHDEKRVLAALDGDRDKKDPERPPLSVMKKDAPKPETKEDDAALAAINAAPGARSFLLGAVCNKALGGAVAHALGRPEQFKAYLTPVPAADPTRPAVEAVPPQDTFHRLAYYTQVNYAALKMITNCLYHDKEDIDLTFGIWDVFSAKTESDADEKFKAWCDKNQQSVPGDVSLVPVGNWVIMQGGKRDNFNFYNKDTAVIQRILERHDEDKRLGQELMRNRVLQEKAKNIRETGPDAPGLKEYSKSTSSRGESLGALGAERVISPEKMKLLEAARGDTKAAQELEHVRGLRDELNSLRATEEKRALLSDEQRRKEKLQAQLKQAEEMLAVPANAVQVDVFTHDTATGTMRKHAIYTKADDPEDIKTREELKRTPGRAPTAVAPREQKAPPLVPAGDESWVAMEPTGVPAFAPHALALMKKETEPRPPGVAENPEGKTHEKPASAPAAARST
jgi:hypothetical protein